MGRSSTGWAVIFMFFVVGVLATCAGAVFLACYLASHLRWI